MLDRYEQVLYCSPAEFERRWAVAREVMKDRGVDLLVVLEGSYEGYSLWLAALRDPRCIILPAEGSLVAVVEDSVLRKKIYPAHPDIEFVGEFDPGLLKGRLGPGRRRIGFVHPEVLRADWYDGMVEALGPFEIVDIGIDLDASRVVKSEEERFLIGESCKLHEKLMAAVPQIVRVGRPVKEITDELIYTACELGSGGHFVHLFLMGYGPQDEPGGLEMGRRKYPGYVLRPGDRVYVLLETNGPGGHYCALGRYAVFGEPSAEMRKHWDMAVRAQANAARMLRPGVSVREVFDLNYAFIEGCGFTTNHQNYLHSLGFQYGERPYLNDPSETVPLREGMFYLAHPVIMRRYPGFDPGMADGVFALDTFFVTREGGIRTSDFSQDLIVLPC